ncbi:MAG: hypothetical protein K2H90_01460 [Oscillospiraceae bacterium]|nr:hypothetical protein [Oscillospiraceae bacterium]
MQNTNGITVSFMCANSAMAAKMIEYFDKLSAESMQQLSDSLRNHPEQWTEYSPDGSSRPAAEPLNLNPPHVSNPDASAVPPNARSGAPAPYQQYAQPTQPAPSVQPPPQQPPVPPAPQASAAPQQVPQQPQPQAQPAPQSAQQPNYQQTSIAYTPAPNAIPSASAPVIQRDKLMNALQLFASSSQAHQIQVRELLARFGVDAVTALPDASIPEFANYLRELGCYV